jgi:hypothetical protein
VAEFQWWLLIVGIVVGGGLVAVVMLDGSRREADISEEERAAEATWIQLWLESQGRDVSREDIDEVLRIHRDYLALPPPDRLLAGEARLAPVRAPAPAAPQPPEPGAGSADADADRDADEVGHDGRSGPDQDLASA